MNPPAGLYLDTSAVLRSILESGTTPEIEQSIQDASLLITSRLSLVESARAITRLRATGAVGESALADATHELHALWARCDIWELTPNVCDLAGRVAPHRPLSSLDALHLATFVLARQRLPDLMLLSTDQRLVEAARGT